MLSLLAARHLILSGEGSEALGQLQEGAGNFLGDGASKQSLGQVGRLEKRCSSKHIPWLVPWPASLRAKKVLVQKSDGEMPAKSCGLGHEVCTGVLCLSKASGLSLQKMLSPFLVLCPDCPLG